ncbi:TIGR01777 family oxidoreductase [Corynebacterium sp. UBA2622]|uniref:TIGR01777 family oxidoreductase n=1 Tax=Corynebacterium sp. UBA2622 TaxID=1946393 RepID=UPI0025BEAAE6|nr:TIGR01777 family oxidoreductase [Corynebacterium sp. UBA2622]
MGITATHTVPAPVDEVWRWHTRPGAAARLTPPFLPMKVSSQARSLAAGTTTFDLPAGQTWVARHDPEGYAEGRQFRDVVANAPFTWATRWRHTHTFHPAGDGSTQITDSIEARVPARFLRPALAYRQSQLAADLEFLSSLPQIRPLTVAVTGSRGLVGTALCAQLGTAGHTVVPLVRGEPGPGERHWDVDSPAPDLLSGIDAVAHLAGEPIIGRFTDARKRRIDDSRVGPTAALARCAADNGVAAFVSASAIGFYGPDAGDRPRTEDDSRGPGFLAGVCERWEEAARVEGVRTVNIRTGLALSGAGGILPVLRASARAGLGARFGRGKFHMSWIAIDDLTDIYVRALVDASITGPVNATAPHPVTNAEMSRALARTLRRPAPLPIPEAGPRILLGREAAGELALADQWVVPGGITRFRYPTLGPALAHELGRERPRAGAGGGL